MSKKNLPKDLLYNRDYAWVKIEEDTATFGVIKPAADKVKEFVFIKLPQKGQEIEQGETFVSLEALKWSGHIAAPLSGEIIEVNDPLFDEPSLINQDPYEKGWIVKIKPTDLSQKDKLLNADEAKEWVDSGMAKK